MNDKKDDGQLALTFLYTRPDEIRMSKCEECGKKMLEAARWLKDNVPGGKQRDKAIKALSRAGEYARAAVLEN